VLNQDPFLTSLLTVPFVRGLQHHPLSKTQLLTTAMLKDVFVYNVENDCESANHTEACHNDGVHGHQVHTDPGSEFLK